MAPSNGQAAWYTEPDERGGDREARNGRREKEMMARGSLPESPQSVGLNPETSK